MSKYIIDSSLPINSQNYSSYYNRSETIKNTGILQNTNYNIRYHKTLFDQNFNSITYKDNNLTSNNDARSVTIDWTPQSIRNFSYNIFTNKFYENYPIIDSYNLCNQKISIVFQAGNTHWTRFSDSLLSYPINYQFTTVNKSEHTLDCRIEPDDPIIGPPEMCDFTNSISYFFENSVHKVRVIVSAIPTVCLLLQIKFFDNMSIPLSDWINIHTITSLQTDIEIPFFSDEASTAIVRLYSCQYVS